MGGGHRQAQFLRQGGEGVHAAGGGLQGHIETARKQFGNLSAYACRSRRAGRRSERSNLGKGRHQGQRAGVLGIRGATPERC